MSFLPSPLPRLRLTPTIGPWLPLAVASTIWLLFLLFGSAWIVPQAPGAAHRPLAVLSPWQAALVLELVGFWAGVALPLASTPRRIASILGLVLLWAAVLVGYQERFGLPNTPQILGLGLAGLVLGLAAGAMAGPLLRRRTTQAVRGYLLSALALGCALVIALVPLAPSNPLTAPLAPSAPNDLVRQIPQQVYVLIKGAMLWVPIGFVFTVGGLGRVLRLWVPAFVIAFFLTAWPFFPGLRVLDLMEVLFAPVGIWLGLWIAERTGVRAEAPAEERVTGDRPPARHSPMALSAPAVADGQGIEVAGSAVGAAPRPLFPTRLLARDCQYPRGAGSGPWDYLFHPWSRRRDGVMGQPPGSLRFARSATGTLAASGPAGSGADERRDGAPTVGLPIEPAPNAHRSLPIRWREHLRAQSFPHPLALPPALALLGLAAWGWWEFPRFQVALGATLLLYLALLLVFRHAWLMAIPALLPVLDLAPWTGRFYLDESDLFLLVTLGAALLHRRDPNSGPFLARPVTVLAVLFGATTLTALLLGLFPLSPLDANAFATYFSHYNALRVGKGFAWGLAFFLLLRWTAPRGSDLPARLFTLGMLLGLLGVVLIGVRERWQFADLLDFSAAYRLTASFSSMHTGDSHLPAYLALAVPFVWLWVVRLRRPEGLLLGLALFAGAIYLVISTVTRASVLALAVELLLLAVLWLRALRGRGGRVAAGALAFVAMAAVAGGLLYLGTQGSYFQQRLATVSEDADTRLTHWNSALWMMDQDLAAQTFGMGLGRFPETYLQHNPKGAIPGNFRYGQEGSNGYLALGSGETLYLAQRVAVEPHTRYRLSFDVRGEAPVLRLTIPLCEKHLLDSHRCQWQGYELPGGPGWQRQEAIIDTGPIGEGNWLSRRPAEVFLYNGEKDQLLAIDNLSLRAPDGRELLSNGDFSAGGDHWFFKTHDHLAWHIKNVWVSLLFEQGWLGLIAFNLLLLAVLIHLWGPAWRGHPVPAATLTAIIGFLAVGLFASPFDAPRLTALFFAVLAVGLHATPAAPTVGPTRRSRRRRRH